MKKQVFRAFIILNLFIAMTASVHAQCVGNGVVMRIPFEFVAGDTTFPPGEYTIKPFSNHSSALLILSKDYSAKAIVLTHAVGNRTGDIQDKTKLVFNRYGNHYFLSQIWTSGYSNGLELFKSHTELETAKSVSKPQNVLITPRPQ
jgi:hypothetical protein